MANDWMLDVLADLKAFAESNGLGATERQLSQTMATVENELHGLQGVAAGTGRSVGHVGELFRPIAEGRNS